MVAARKVPSGSLASRIDSPRHRRPWLLPGRRLQRCSPPSLPASAEKIANPVAGLPAGLDKITGRIISFDVYIDETVQFGALQVTPRVCYIAATDRRRR